MYYHGTAVDSSKASISSYNTALRDAMWYHYSEKDPALNGDGTAYDGNYWHYGTNGEIVIWTYTESEE